MLVVGSINVDLVVSVDRLPRPGETVTGGEFARHQGGKGANQAVAAARAGARVSFVGAVGDDDEGRAALNELRREGVDTGGIATLAGSHTGVALIVVDGTGENQIAVASGANAHVDGALVERALGDADLVSQRVLLINFEIPDEALLGAARHGAGHGMRVVLNPAPARPLPDELLALEPILLANAGEAAALTGERDPAASAERLSAMTGRPAIVTLGERGALLNVEGETQLLPAPAVTAVDTTGAGDAFTGALAAELARGTAIEQAARFGVVAASLSVTRRGARAGMPRREQVETLLR